jgi:hypothetical protein
LLSGLALQPEDSVANPAPGPRPTRVRFQLSIDSPWLAGEFEGVAQSDRSPSGPLLRAQIFGDLGPKMADLTVRPNRIVGYFPQTREGIDCALPGEASPHPLLFMGAGLAEELWRRETALEVTGVRQESGGAWLRLRPLIPGTEIHRFMSADDRSLKRRRYWWMLGVHWEEEWTSTTECRISAPHFSMRLKILERGERGPSTPLSMDLSLPEDVRIVAGSRK